ncbi:hypothetical protein pdam_00022304 [Pocillopora damicornis]|uniref:Uncharacterized protein n=1 Tax=Pocillopora damicornis TaxID=46731 RepID=A0A3M6U6W3_POCDA|nr:hypothetical protein pdam_00022304 [Pocillopora damicornis]
MRSVFEGVPLNVEKCQEQLQSYYDTFITKDVIRVEQVLTKSLGVTIDDKLCWNCHIEKLTIKIACGIGDMKRVSNLIPQATLLLIYQDLAQSHFDYCSTVWGACEKIAE